MFDRQYKNLLLFLSITFLIPIISVYLQTLTKNPTMKFIFYGIEAAAPSIATIIIITKNKSYKSFFTENFRRKRWIAACILPVVLVFTTMLITKLIACFLLRDHFSLCSIPINQVIIISWAFIAEELGWRGWLSPFLNKQMKKTYLVPFVVGSIWCLWHYHYFLFGDMQVPLVCFFTGCIVESYIYSWLLNWSNHNLLSAMMYHFAWNLFIHIFAINPIDNMGNSLPYIVLCIVEIFIYFSLFFIEKNKLVKL